MYICSSPHWTHAAISAAASLNWYLGKTHAVYAGGIGGRGRRNGSCTGFGGPDGELKLVLLNLLLAAHRIKILIRRIQGDIVPLVRVELYRSVGDAGKLDIERYGLDHGCQGGW